MTLLSEYQDASEAEFITRVGMALVHDAVPVMTTSVTVTTDAEKRAVRFAVRVLLGPYAEGVWVARGLAQAGMSNASSDVAIQAAITANWAALAWTRDQTHGV